MHDGLRPEAAAVGRDQAPTAPLPTLPFSLRGLLAAAVLVPLLLLGGAAWYDWRRLDIEAHADVNRLSAIVKEHALKVVETKALILDRLEDRVRGLSWAEIAANGTAIQRDMLLIDERMPQITALHLVRPDGRLAVLSTAWPTPLIDLSGRAYFRRLAAGASGLVFGEPVTARMSGIVTFTMARRRGHPEGPFDGAVVGSVLPGYFQAHWHELGVARHVTISLMRSDGQVMVTHPRGESDLMPPPDPANLPRGLQEAHSLPVIERIGRRGEFLAAYRQVGEHPLVIAVSLSRDAVRADWLRNTAITAALCLAAALALVAVTLQAIRRWRSERAMLVRLSATTEELRAEIARREAAEAGLMQAQRLEALGRLTGGIAHDFNNLLTAILGTVQLLERHLGSAADERARRLLGVARDAVSRGARLNASLLAFARRQRLRPTALDANELVRGFMPLIKGALGEAISLDVALAADLPPCHADATQLEAALLNLAINARDAMPEAGGRCTLSTRLVQLGPRELAGNPDAKPGAYVAIALTDTGSGMLPEVRDRAFEPFFTTKPIGRGTGLGLSQVFGFIRQLGGHVALDSAPGRGTTATLFLPADAAGMAAADAAIRIVPSPGVRPTAAPTGLTVLVAEDDEQVRQVTAETLRSAGMRVLTAADGRAALALLEGGAAVDVLFSDIVMPGGLNGIELARAARRLRPDLAVLLATGYAGTVAGGEDHGFEIMPKPYDQDAVASRLAELAAVQAGPVA